MVLFLPKVKSFGEEFGGNLGAGLGQGFSQALQSKQEEKREFKKLAEQARLKQETDLAKIKAKQDMVNSLFGRIQPQQDKGNALRGGQESLDDMEEGMQLPQGFDSSNIADEDIIKASVIDKGLGDTFSKLKETSLKKTQGEKKEVTESFKENSPYINKVYDSYEDALRKEAIFDRMDQLEESGELSDSGMINFLESIGLKPEWLKNPANEEYSKLSLDLLGGGTLQADYGSRVLASEFKVSQQRIPTLSQTPEGRKQIKENLRTMLLPARLKQERMAYYIDKSKRTGKPLPHDLRGQVLKDIKPQLEEAYDKFKQRNGRYPVREGTPPDDDAIEKYYFLSDGNEIKAMKMMKEDGYDVSE